MTLDGSLIKNWWQPVNPFSCNLANEKYRMKGWMDGWTDQPTNGQPENIMRSEPEGGRGIKNCTLLVENTEGLQLHFE